MRVNVRVKVLKGVSKKMAYDRVLFTTNRGAAGSPSELCRLFLEKLDKLFNRIKSRG